MSYFFQILVFPGSSSEFLPHFFLTFILLIFNTKILKKKSGKFHAHFYRCIVVNLISQYCFLILSV